MEPPVANRGRRAQQVSGDSDAGPAVEPESTEPEEEDPSPLSMVVPSPEKKKDTTAPKTAPPSVDEWQDFIGRMVVRNIADFYVSAMLKDLDLTPVEWASIKLEKEDLDEISAPLASGMHKTTFARRHGRKIISASDSFEAVVALAMWARRVRRIARRHARMMQPKQQAPVQGVVIGESNGQSTGQDEGQGPAGFYSVYNPGTG